MNSQRNKKSYWHTYTDMLKEIHESDPNYDPIPNWKDWAQRVRVILNSFLDVYDTMIEKLGHGKKQNLTIVQDTVQLEEMVQNKDLVQNRESTNKRKREKTPIGTLVVVVEGSDVAVYIRRKKQGKDQIDPNVVEVPSLEAITAHDEDR